MRVMRKLMAAVIFAGICVAGMGAYGQGAGGAAEEAVVLPRTEKDGVLQINGARVIGATPGRPFLYKIAATGVAAEQIAFGATGLPEGLSLDPKTGLITGAIKKSGVTVVTLQVEDRLRLRPVAPVTRKLVIVGGEGRLALTPPMGWNSWNCFAGQVSQERVKAAADAFVSTGLAAHGFTYVNIDDCWEGQRDKEGMIQTNEKFPDMKGLGDDVHSLGLKLGIYSSPGPKTWRDLRGAISMRSRTARQWANWGVDYVKYDLCSYGQVMREQGKDVHDPKALQAVYAVMRSALDKAPRDIVYSLCEYGNGKVWEWGGAAPVEGNLWRTTGDIRDTWGSMSGIGFGQNGHEKFAGPGHWNDPDMLVVGRVGWGRPHASRLTENEQITHISLWSMLAAPLLIGCDLGQMDDFTKALLMNDEVLAVDQDPLGKQGYRVDGGAADAQVQVWKKELWDGRVAVGLFNLSEPAKEVTAKWSDLGITGKQAVRDLWQLKDLGEKDGEFSVQVPRHGCVLVKIGKAVSEEEAVGRVVAMYRK